MTADAIAVVVVSSRTIKLVAVILVISVSAVRYVDLRAASRLGKIDSGFAQRHCRSATISTGRAEMSTDP